MTARSSDSKKMTTKRSAKNALVYLAHPIASANLQSAHWKGEFLDLFESAKLPLKLIDPSRNGFVDGKHDDLIVRSNKRSIALSVAVVAYAETPSAGTSMEIFYAHMLGIPVFSYCPSRIPAWVMMHSTSICRTIDCIIAHLRRLEV